MKRTSIELCEEHAARGYEHVRAGEYGKAFAVAKKLRKLRYSGEHSAGAQYYRVLLRAAAPEGAALPECMDGYRLGGFFSSIDVVADSPEEALCLIESVYTIEPFTERSLERWEVLEPRPLDPKGVYRLEGCWWYAGKGG